MKEFPFLLTALTALQGLNRTTVEITLVLIASSLKDWQCRHQQRCRMEYYFTPSVSLITAVATGIPTFSEI